MSIFQRITEFTAVSFRVIFGQLAEAYYGEERFPILWRNKIAEDDMILVKAKN
jgi:hypothetical protein